MKISDLPEGLRQLAEKRREEYLARSETRVFQKDLFNGFTWSETKEGYNFWNTISRGYFEEWFEIQRKELEKIESHMLSFGSWLTENCELNDMVWRYESEDWTLEGVYKEYLKNIS